MKMSVGFETFYKAAKGTGADGGLHASVYYVVSDPYIEMYLPLSNGVVLHTSVVKDDVDAQKLRELTENGVPCVNVLA